MTHHIFPAKQTSGARSHRRWPAIAMSLVLVAFLTACSSSGSTKVSVDQQQSIPPGSTLAIKVEPAPEVADEEDTKLAVTDWASSQNSMADAMRELVEEIEHGFQG